MNIPSVSKTDIVCEVYEPYRIISTENPHVKPDPFTSVGDFSSYCRKVPSKWTSNTKRKGKGNVKNGNKYLAWAFSEAAEMSRRYNDSAKAFFNRKSAKTNRMVAHATLAHKLARASYYIMRDGVEFDSKKLFA